MAIPSLILSSGFETAHEDRKSTRLNSSHSQISYAVFCLKKKKRDCEKPLTLVVNCLNQTVLKSCRFFMSCAFVRVVQDRTRFASLYLITFFFFNDTATTEIYTLSLHDALPI